MSDHTPGAAPEPGRQPWRDTPGERLIRGAYGGSLDDIEQALRQGADINGTHPETGLSVLHIAVGLNDLPLCRYLVERCNARFFPDGFGRWPTLVAAENRVDDELADYIVEKEAEFLAREQSGASGP